MMHSLFFRAAVLRFFFIRFVCHRRLFFPLPPRAPFLFFRSPRSSREAARARGLSFSPTPPLLFPANGAFLLPIRMESLRRSSRSAPPLFFARVVPVARFFPRMFFGKVNQGWVRSFPFFQWLATFFLFTVLVKSIEANRVAFLFLDPPDFRTSI